MTWPLVFAILGTGVILGRLLDVGLHRLYTPKLSDWLYTRAIWADGLTYVELLHADTRRAARVLDRVFGSRTFSPRMLMVSVAPLAVLLLYFLLFYSSSRPDPSIYDALRATIASNGREGLVMVITNVLQDQVSLRLTRGILHRTRPTLHSLGFWTLVDALLTFFFASLPLALYMVTGILASPGQPHPTAERFIVLLGQAIPWVLMLPARQIAEVAPRGDISMILPEVLLLLVVFGGAIPTLIHLSMLIRDLTTKTLVRPACVYLSGLLETLAGHDRPMTTILTGVGTIPVLVKLWLDVIK